MPEYVDLRSPLEVVWEARSLQPLDDADEVIAQKLAELLKRTDDEYANDMPAYERTTAEIKSIGDDLCSRRIGEASGVSGASHMKLIAYRVRVLGGRIRTLEMFWSGLCGWQY